MVKNYRSLFVVLSVAWVGSAGCSGDDGGGGNVSAGVDAGQADADPNFFDPAGTWSVGVRSGATVRASYDSVQREGTAVARDITFSPVLDIELVISMVYDEDAHQVSLIFSDSDRTVTLDENNSGSVELEGPATERVVETLCDMTRSLRVDLAFESWNYMTQTFVHTVTYQDGEGTCTEPAGICTCAQVIASGVANDPPNAFYNSIRDAKTAAEEPVLDGDLAAELNELSVHYYMDGEHVQTRIVVP